MRSRPAAKIGGPSRGGDSPIGLFGTKAVLTASATTSSSKGGGGAGRTGLTPSGTGVARRVLAGPTSATAIARR